VGDEEGAAESGQSTEIVAPGSMEEDTT